MRRAAAAAALALAGCLVVAAPAGAAKFTRLGKAAPNVMPGDSCSSCHAFQVKTAASSPSYVVPRGRWKIVSWKAAGDALAPVEARLHVYRRTNVPGQFKIVAESKSESFPAGTVTEHKAKIRVRRGDRLGIVSLGAMPVSYTTTKGGDVSGRPDNCGVIEVGTTLGGGGDCDLTTFGLSRANVAARLKRR